MRYSLIAPIALVAGANAWGNATYTTEIVTEYTTYCPSPTEVVHGTQTYTVTEATTLTITNCPCTVTKPVIPTYSTSAVVIPSSVETHPSPAPTTVETHVTPAPPAPTVETSVEVPPVSLPSPIPPFPVPSSEVTTAIVPAPTASAPSVAPVSPATPAPSPFTGAGNKVAASGMGLAALAGLAAFFL